jgi:hypothetical protein
MPALINPSLIVMLVDLISGFNFIMAFKKCKNEQIVNIRLVRNIKTILKAPF